MKTLISIFVLLSSLSLMSCDINQSSEAISSFYLAFPFSEWEIYEKGDAVWLMLMDGVQVYCSLQNCNVGHYPHVSLEWWEKL